MRFFALVAVAATLGLAGCDDQPKANTDDPQYKLGYQAGQDDEKSQICGQIEDYKDSIAQALKEADICPD